MVNHRFDSLTVEKLQYYVYALVDPRSKLPFYIGKGLNNRVFDHVKQNIPAHELGAKLDVIQEVQASGNEVKHYILRHGLSEKEAFEVESALIDFAYKFKVTLTNIVEGHHASKRGLMTTTDVIRKYNAQPLTSMEDPAMIININKAYRRGSDKDEIYEATRQAWVVGKKRRETIRYALAEYGGVIIEVFEIHDWFAVTTNNNIRNNRWGFNGKVAPDQIRSKYLNKSINHIKKRGAANPIRYKI